MGKSNRYPMRSASRHFDYFERLGGSLQFGAIVATLNDGRLVITYRSFLNTDTPKLVDIWLKQTPCRSIAQIINRKMLDQMVFAKPFFDPAGLILAFDGDQPVGFVHAGFAPNVELNGVDLQTGIICQLRVIDRSDADQIAEVLFAAARQYFRAHDTRICYAGGKFPYSPFYTGLYGGSRIPGVPDDDQRSLDFFRSLGFESTDQINVMQINLNGYRPPVSRSQMTVRRQYQVSAIVDPLLSNWWESCTYGWAEIFGFRILRRADQAVVGSVMFWEIQPLSAQWGKPTMGLVDLAIDDVLRKQGLATFLVGESLRHLVGQGVACVEVQMRVSDEPSIALAQKVGFEKFATGEELVYLLENPE